MAPSKLPISEETSKGIQQSQCNADYQLWYLWSHILLLSFAESQTVNAMSYQVFVGSPAPINAEKLSLFHYRCSTNGKTCCHVA